MIPTRSPFIVRTGFTLPQVTAPIADWAPKNRIKRVVTMVTDYGPGLDAEKTFIRRVFKAGGGEIVESIRTPLRNPDYAPFLQRAKDAKPDALFVFVPSGEGLAVMKQFEERGLKQAGIRLIGTGDVTDDDLLVSMGAPARRRDHFVPLLGGARLAREQGVRRRVHEGEQRDAAELPLGRRLRRHASHLRGAEEGRRPDATGEQAGRGDEGDEMDEPARARCRSTRRPATPIQNVYMREVKMVNGQPWNVEFDKVENVKDPGVIGHRPA